MRSAPVTEIERSELRGLLGALLWPATQTCPKLAAELSLLQSLVPQAKVSTLLDANKLLGRALADEYMDMRIHSFNKDDEICTVVWSDASWANRPDDSSTGGLFSALTTTAMLRGLETPVSAMNWATQKLKRICRSSLAAEVQALANAEQECHFLRLQWAEIGLGIIIDTDKVKHLEHVAAAIIIDAKSIYDAMHGAQGPLELQEANSSRVMRRTTMCQTRICRGAVGSW